MGKRILSLLSVIVLALAGIKAPVSAAAMKSPYVAEQAQGKAPNVTVYMTGSNMPDVSSVSG